MSQRDSGRICSQCGDSFPATGEFFHNDKQKPGGLRPDCKACCNLRRRQDYISNRERVLLQTKDYQKANRDRINQHVRNRRGADEAFRLAARKRVAKARAANIETIRAAERKRVKENPGKNAAKSALARARRRQAAPPWLTPEHKRQMRDLYIQAAITGMHVDHIYPICGENSCGLHVPWNLQILPPTENLKKGNRLVAA